MLSVYGMKDELRRPMMQVKEYAMKAKEKGTKLYVLTTSGTKIETAAKRRFLDRYYAGMFDDIYAVEHDDDKVRFILKKAAELGIEPSDCELVEVPILKLFTDSI